MTELPPDVAPIETSGPGYDSRPPLRRTITEATKRYGPGRPCPKCQRTKPATCRTIWCAACLDQRDARKRNPLDDDDED